MANKVVEVNIGENTYWIHRFPAFEAVEVLGDLQRQFAGPLLGMMDGKQSASPEEANANMMQAFGKLSASIDGKTLKALAERLVIQQRGKSPIVTVSMNGEEPRPVDDRTVNLCLETAADVLQLCWEVIRHNFSEVIARFNTPFTPAGTSPAASQ